MNVVTGYSRYTLLEATYHILYQIISADSVTTVQCTGAWCILNGDDEARLNEVYKKVRRIGCKFLLKMCLPFPKVAGWIGWIFVIF